MCFWVIFGQFLTHHPEDLKLFLGEHQFFGIKKLKNYFFDRESKYFPIFSTQ
jgi:hypothetical protein